MPYISQHRRKRFDSFVNSLIDRCDTPGDLTYVIYRLSVGLVRRYSKYSGKVNYSFLADILGSLTASKAEFYRRIVAPYEDVKIEENGDVEVK